MKIFIFSVFLVTIATVSALNDDNIALNRPVAQSSVADGGVPERAVDGNRAADWGQGSCTATNRDIKPWWQVDLGAIYDIKTVTLTNRGDCCGNRLKNFDIMVSNVDAETLRTTVIKMENVCHTQISALGSGETRSFTCGAQTKPGRYVIIMKRGNAYLTLCEVEVYGEKQRVSNIALNRPVAQSSVADGGVPERAVDGYMASNWILDSCTSTMREYNPWWQVDLGDRYDIKNVTITNRGDCCGDRLKNFDIMVSDFNNVENLRMSVMMESVCHAQTSAIGSGETRTFTCGAQTKPGRYVIIMKRGRGILTLCEVEVYGEMLQ